MNKLNLIYHKGKNFGDALNPMIFKHYLGDFVSDSSNIQLIGIGTLLGLKKDKGKKVVFSSGVSVGQEATYGDLPEINEDYDFYCVRGPKTAQVLGLKEDLAICDGAYLLNDFYDFKSKQKDIEVSYMPHHKSEDMFPEIGQVLASCGINYISPTWDCDKCLDLISRSKLIICEAMHGAIVADSLRVPWVPVKSYPFIDEFKWQDFILSMSIKDFKFNYLTSLHTTEFFKKLILKRIKVDLCTSFIGKLIMNRRVKKFKRELLDLIKDHTSYISSETIIKEKVNQLKSVLSVLKKDYL